MLNKEVKKGRLFVVSAPAGTGKTTLLKNLTEEFPSVKTSISFTTRNKRPNEIPGVDYNFISRDEFQKKIDEGEFLEYIELYGAYYGTSKSHVEKLQTEGYHVVLVIDTQGGLKLKKQMAVTLIFVMPPSFDDRARGCDGVVAGHVVEDRRGGVEPESRHVALAAHDQPARHALDHDDDVVVARLGLGREAAPESSLHKN